MVKGKYAVKGEQMKKYLGEEKTLAESFTNFQIEAILKESNKEADTLSKYSSQPTLLNIHFIKIVAHA